MATYDSVLGEGHWQGLCVIGLDIEKTGGMRSGDNENKGGILKVEPLLLHRSIPFGKRVGCRYGPSWLKF